MADSAAALRKLQSGQTLTQDERDVLGLGPAPTTTTFTQPMTIAGQTSTLATPTEDEYVTNWRSGLKAKKGTALANLYEQQNADRELRDAAFANKPTEPAGEGYFWQWQERNRTWARIKATGFGAPDSTGSPGGAGGNVNTGGSGNNYIGSGTSADPLKLNGVNFTGSLGGVNYVNGIKEDTAKKTAQSEFRAALSELGLADLADEVDRLIKEDYTVAQIKMELPKTSAYQLRFPGMDALRKAGRAISEATYIANERGYQQTLRAYGLDTAVFGSRSEMGKYIALEVSPREFEERVNLASTRVKDNPDVMNTFKSYFPEVDESGVISYLLNPTKGMDIIKKQIRTTEIGAAATKAGFANQVNAAYAGTLIGAVGESTYAQISNEFQRARQLANSQRRLAQIENQAYSDLEAVSAVVGDEVNAALASERRAAREVARFGTRGGITGTSLGTTAQI